MLEVLVQKSDFTNQWDWVNSSIGQFPDVPSQENGQLIEWATHSLQGYYGTERYQMNFFHVLHRYDREVTLADIEAIEFPHTANSKTVQLALKPLGNQEIVNCIKTTEILECQVAGVYKNIVSIFRFWLPSNMQEDEIIKVLDPVLEKVDSRAKELEGIK